jgi:hypothetical protein
MSTLIAPPIVIQSAGDTSGRIAKHAGRVGTGDE